MAGRLSKTGLKPATRTDAWSKSLREERDGPKPLPFITPKGTRGTSLGTSTTSFNKTGGKVLPKAPILKRSDRQDISLPALSPRPGPSGVRRMSESAAGSASRQETGREDMKRDALNTEFIYYSSALKILAPTLTRSADRELIMPWINKLFGPQYHARNLRDKRNRFLCALVIMLLNNEVSDIFRQKPPTGPLPPFTSLPVFSPPLCAWEVDTMWADTLTSLPDDYPLMQCSVFGCPCEGSNCARIDPDMGHFLDEEFQYLLYLTRPFASLFINANDRTKVATWLQILCTITKNSCDIMKGIRNDYIMALYGFAHELRLDGPFTEYPPYGSPLPPLADAARTSRGHKGLRFMDPTGTEAEEFLDSQPIPDDGAFAYICVTGDMLKPGGVIAV